MRNNTPYNSMILRIVDIILVGVFYLIAFLLVIFGGLWVQVGRVYYFVKRRVR